MDRILMTPDKFTGLRTVEQKYASECIKPKGLWYGIGTSWLDWCQYEMPHWVPPLKHIYRLDIDPEKILVIDSAVKFAAFQEEYRCAPPWAGKIAMYRSSRIEWIAWERVATRYSGIEIAPYQWDYRLDSFWYYGWDVASGCVWHSDAVHGWERLNRYKFLKLSEENER